MAIKKQPDPDRPKLIKRIPMTSEELISTWRLLANDHVGEENERLLRLADQLADSQWANQCHDKDKTISLKVKA